MLNFLIKETKILKFVKIFSRDAEIYTNKINSLTIFVFLLSNVFEL